jgi:hypothetical protein
MLTATSRVMPHSGQAISWVVSLGSISSDAPHGQETDIPFDEEFVMRSA